MRKRRVVDVLLLVAVGLAATQIFVPSLVLLLGVFVVVAVALIIEAVL